MLLAWSTLAAVMVLGVVHYIQCYGAPHLFGPYTLEFEGMRDCEEGHPTNQSERGISIDLQLDDEVASGHLDWRTNLDDTVMEVLTVHVYSQGRWKPVYKTNVTEVCSNNTTVTSKLLRVLTNTSCPLSKGSYTFKLFVVNINQLLLSLYPELPFNRYRVVLELYTLPHSVIGCIESVASVIPVIK